MLNWSKAANGNWNGKAGPYTMMVVSFHVSSPSQEEGWWLHPKLPGLAGQMVKNSSEGKTLGDRLFAEWLREIGIKP